MILLKISKRDTDGELTHILSLVPAIGVVSSEYFRYTVDDPLYPYSRAVNLLIVIQIINTEGLARDF